MSTLVEAMARAIYREFENRPDYAQLQMNGIIAEECALAALKAMREVPFDHALNDAGWIMLAGLEDNGPVSGKQFNNLKLIFRGALVKYFDAALQEHSTTPPRNAS